METKKRFFNNVSIQSKIIGLVIMLILLIVSSITVMFIIFEYQKDIEKAESIAFQTAETLSYMPSIQEALLEGTHHEEIGFTLENIREDIHASAIIVSDRERMIFINPSDGKPLEKWEEGIQDTALLYGNSYVKTVGEGTEGLLIGVSAIHIDYGSYGKVEGTVSVVYEMSSILAEIMEGIKKILAISLMALLFGIFGSWWLAKDIRKDTLGLEPKEIAALYRERNAVFQSIRDGLIVVDADETVSMMNQMAKKMLHVKKDVKGQNLYTLLESEHLSELLGELQENDNTELEYKGKMFIANSQPVFQEEKKMGTIYSLRDKTEVKKMAATLNEVKQYSEDLRAQTHEFKNKLYVLLGLLQLGKTKDAIDFINEETDSQQTNADVLQYGIRDSKVQAILLGKIAKASEIKENFFISPESSLEPLPDYIELLPLLTILGNLIDNAFDSAKKVPEGHVSFFATDIGHDIIFEVTDNGQGISAEKMPFIFNKGYSTKGEDRGYGLHNVMDELVQLGGEIEVDSEKQKGTTFTIILPKEPIEKKERRENK